MASPPPVSAAQHAVWTQYRDNLPRHLIGIARHLQFQVMHSLTQDLGHHALRLSFGPFLTLVGQQGCRLTTIASELGISKQACNQTAKQIERAGYIERRPAPEDGRGRLAVLTEKGRELAEQGERLITNVEAAYREFIGEQVYPDFAAALHELRLGLNLSPQAMDSAPRRARIASGGVVLPLVAEQIQRRIRVRMIAKGHSGLKMSHSQVLLLIGPEGGRIGEMARIQAVSRQAISAIARDLKGQGYLQRRPDPVDGRGVVLTLTDAGQALIADAVDAVRELEDELEAILGRTGLDRLRELARQLYRSLRLEEEIFGPVATSDPAGAEIDLESLSRQLRTRLGEARAERLARLLRTSEATNSEKGVLT
ncbi:MAG: MarR family transcriptional regulator [Deltaproteobacteria bacterium]|nr:MarR family transcriptional regulator [Deltaproteobacteria bacterium]MBW2361228.1 MarR family transcriptional regulator [Deltaproteobacteria bacterium]